jgi:hypothetical protein
MHVAIFNHILTILNQRYSTKRVESSARVSNLITTQARTTSRHPLLYSRTRSYKSYFHKSPCFAKFSYVRLSNTFPSVSSNSISRSGSNLSSFSSRCSRAQSFVASSIRVTPWKCCFDWWRRRRSRSRSRSGREVVVVEEAEEEEGRKERAVKEEREEEQRQERV